MTAEEMLVRLAELQAEADYGVGYTTKERNEFLRLVNGLDFGRLMPMTGTETNCPIEGVHEHAFRGPHRFREWEPGT